MTVHDMYIVFEQKKINETIIIIIRIPIKIVRRVTWQE